MPRENRDHFLPATRVTEEEEKAVLSAAETSGKRLSEWQRDTMLEAARRQMRRRDT